MHRRTIALALAVVLIPIAAGAQAPQTAAPHPPGAHETGATQPPVVPHPPSAHQPVRPTEPAVPHPQGAHESGQAQAVPHPVGAHEPKAYIPGIEQFMNVIQREHAKLWYAGKAHNWPLAAYQLSEIKEVMSDVQDVAPTFKNLPLATMLDAVITGEVAQLEKAVDAKNAKAFAAGYGKLTAACNACHQATGNGFIVIQRPGAPGFPNQDFEPHK